jgi:plasmid replication initiation protein
MKKNEGLDTVTEREYKVVKANEIIQKAKFDLGLLEQKTFCYAVSKIKPNDAINTEYVFSINDYCDACGINRNSGKTIEEVKKALKKLRDKSFYLLDEKGSYVLIGWLSKVRVDPKSGKIAVIFDEDMQKYLIGLYENYTQYSLLCILPMRSSYSIRLYELLKSFSGFNCKEFDIDDLQMKLCSYYKRFPDFRRKVLEVATKEINLYTDIEISWQPIKKGRKVVKVKFDIKKREGWNYCSNMYRSNYKLDNKEDPY